MENRTKSNFFNINFKKSHHSEFSKIFSISTRDFQIQSSTFLIYIIHYFLSFCPFIKHHGRITIVERESTRVRRFRDCFQFENADAADPRDARKLRRIPEEKKEKRRRKKKKGQQSHAVVPFNPLPRYVEVGCRVTFISDPLHLCVVVLPLLKNRAEYGRVFSFCRFNVNPVRAARYTSSGDFPKGCCYVIDARREGFERKNRVTEKLN